MAGHSKWHNIQHRKNKQDALRGKLFSKLIRDLTTAARAGGADPAANALLRTAIDKAKTANMTNDTIQRAIQRGAGGADGQDFFPVRYEGYAPGGIAVVVSCETDNRNRTVASVRHAFSKCGGNLGTDGSVAYLFDEVGLLQFSDIDDTDALFEAAVEAGADDVRVSDDGIIDVVTASTKLATVRDALEAHGYIADEAELTLLPQTLVDCDDETAQALGRLLDMLDAIDDVQRVCHNAA